MFRFKLLFFVISIIFLAGCKQGSSKKQVTADSTAQTPFQPQVFYTLPSPMEVASVVESSDLVFNPVFLHSVDSAQRYETDFARAINFGIYAADLSFAIVFDQPRYIDDYYETLLKIGDKLGLIAAVGDSLLEQIRQNLDNPARLQRMFSEVFFRTDAYLQDQNREYISDLIVFGGWLESLYLTLSFAKASGFDNPQNQRILRLIADQRYLLQDIKQLLQLIDRHYPVDLISDIERVEAQINQLSVLNQVEEYDSLSDSVYVVERTEYKLDKRKLDKLLKIVSEIREKYVNLH